MAASMAIVAATAARPGSMCCTCTAEVIRLRAWRLPSFNKPPRGALPAAGSHAAVTHSTCACRLLLYASAKGRGCEDHLACVSKKQAGGLYEQEQKDEESQSSPVLSPLLLGPPVLKPRFQIHIPAGPI